MSAKQFKHKSFGVRISGEMFGSTMLQANGNRMAQDMNDMASMCRALNDRWWRNPKTGRLKKRNRLEMLMLIVTELAEGAEGERKDIMDNHLPHRKMAEVELADAVIRIFDYAAGHGYDLGGAVVEKCQYNLTRADHSKAARLAPGGKKC
jgi:NTP pyrophosphatase (non-canonical NTP hydrolase)